MAMLTFKYRLKSGDRHRKRHAIVCHQVWNVSVITKRETAAPSHWSISLLPAQLPVFKTVNLLIP